MGDVQIQKKERKYIFKEIIGRFQNKWQKSHPSSYVIYQTFTRGLRAVGNDCYSYAKLYYRHWKGERLRDFTSHDVHTFYTAPRKLSRIAPVVLVALVPGSVPLMILLFQFPQYLLSHHFWTPTQQRDFIRKEFHSRMQHYPKVLQSLESSLPRLNNADNQEILLRWLKQLTNEREIPLDDLIQGYRVFDEPCLKIENLLLEHQIALCGAHYLLKWPLYLTQSRLQRHAHMLSLEDHALLREHNDQINTLLSSIRSTDNAVACPDSTLQRNVLIKLALHRGVYAYGYSDDELESVLRKYFTLASQIPVTNISFYLHLPILLFYPHSSTLQYIKHPWTLKSRS